MQMFSAKNPCTGLKGKPADEVLRFHDIFPDRYWFNGMSGFCIFAIIKQIKYIFNTVHYLTN